METTTCTNLNFTREKGIALIVVLSFLLLVGLLTSAIVTISQLSARKMKLNSDREYSSYLAEGAAARLQWLIINNKLTKSNAANQFGNIDTAMIFDQFSPTGKIQNMKYYDSKINVAILDMNSGFDISSFNPAGNLRVLQNVCLAEGKSTDELDVFLNRLADYVDRGPTIHPNGLERSDYIDMGLAPLPRNDRMQYRDEILWIPGAERFFQPDSFGCLSIFNIIPPRGLYFEGRTINFFSANKLLLMSKGGFTSDEADYIIQRRNAWLDSESEPIYGYIDPNIMDRIKKNFSLQGSDYYTLVIQASPGQGFARRTLIVSLRISNYIMNQGNQYYQYLLY